MGDLFKNCKLGYSTDLNIFNPRGRIQKSIPIRKKKSQPGWCTTPWTKKPPDPGFPSTAAARIVGSEPAVAGPDDGGSRCVYRRIRSQRRWPFLHSETRSCVPRLVRGWSAIYIWTRRRQTPKPTGRRRLRLACVWSMVYLCARVM